jgi:hypothetical protein
MIKLLYKPAGMLVSVRRAGQSEGGYARLFRSRGGPLRRALRAQGAGRNQMAKCGLSETRRQPAAATMSFRAWQSAMTAK